MKIVKKLTIAAIAAFVTATPAYGQDSDANQDSTESSDRLTLETSTTTPAQYRAVCRSAPTESDCASVYSEHGPVCQWIGEYMTNTGETRGGRCQISNRTPTAESESSDLVGDRW